MEADILESKKGSISCPEVWRPICLIKGLVLMVIFCSVHRPNCLFHYHGCSACYRNS